jgi:hypothetical protein
MNKRQARRIATAFAASSLVQSLGTMDYPFDDIDDVDAFHRELEAVADGLAKRAGYSSASAVPFVSTAIVSEVLGGGR